MSARLTKLLPLLILAVGILVSAVLYLGLIFTNCESSGLMDMADDVRAFHTDTGC